MQVDDVPRVGVVGHLVSVVNEDEEQIEPRHDGGAHLNGLSCGGEDGGSGIEVCFDSGLGDGDRLLFHGFVDSHGVVNLHLVELVDAADSVVRQHESS